MLAFVACSLSLFSTPFEYNGVYYERTSKVWSGGDHTLDFDVYVTTPMSGSMQVFGYYSGDIVIPAQFVMGGYTYHVVEIGDNAFTNCINLTSLTLPNTIKKIGVRSFFFAYELTDLTLPNSIKEIEQEAFRECKNLTSIVIPDSVITIATKTFYHCENLKDITIGNSVTTIATDAFTGCSKLTNVTWNAIDCQNIILFSSPKMVKSFTFGPAVTWIPDGCCQNLVNLNKIDLNCTMLEYIGEKSFQNTAIRTIAIPSSVRSIKQYAFAGCANLSAVNIPEGVTVIQQGVFSGSGITSAILPERITSIEPYAYANCQSLAIVEIPQNITTINHVFDSCGNIKQVTWNAKNCIGADFGPSIEKFTFGESVQIIPWNICKNMTKLTSIVVPNSVEQIYTGAFKGCSSVTSIHLGKNVRKIGNYAFEGTKISTLVIPDLVDTIGGSAFANSSLLSSVVVGKNVKYIDGYAFGNCTNLKTIFNYSTLLFVRGYSDGAIALYATEIYNQMEKVGDFLFANQSGYKLIAYTGNDSEISLPASFRGHDYTIRKGVFNNNLNLTSVTIPNGLTHIGDSVFASCSNLATISIPNSMEEIGKNAFAGCVSLTKVNLGSGLQQLGQYAFNGCTGLTELIFGSSIQTIGLNAFNGCNGITAITCMSTTPPVLANSTVSHISASIPVNIPAGTAPAYQAATGWSHFTNYIQTGLVAATGITVSSTKLNMAIHDEEVLTATILPSNATYKSYTWSSSNPQVADIQGRVVKAKSAGSCVLTCTSTDGGYTATCTVTVAANAVFATGMRIRGSVYVNGDAVVPYQEFSEGDTLSFMELGIGYITADVLPNNVTNGNIDFMSSDPSVASVELWSHNYFTSSLKIKPHRPGIATITITTLDGSNISRNIIVKITPNPTIHVIGVSLSPKTLTIEAGTTDTLHATILPVNATNQYLYRSSSPWGKLSVNNGVVTAKSSSGTAVVKCQTSDGSFVDSCIVTIVVPVTGVALNKTDIELSVNSYFITEQLRTKFTPTGASNKNVIWTSEDESIATVTETGLVTAVGPGTTTITCTTEDGGYTARCTVTVKGTVVAVTGVSLNKTSLSMNIGDTQTLTATVTPSNAANKNVSWSTSNSAVATVSETGFITAIASGTAMITCTTVSGNYSASCSVTVTDPSAVVINVTGVSISRKTLALNIGNTETLSATVAPSNATNQNVIWMSSNSSAATVSASGVVSAVAEGVTTITCKTVDGKFTAECYVVVTDANSGYDYSCEPTTATVITFEATDLQFSELTENGVSFAVLANDNYILTLMFAGTLTNGIIQPGTYPVSSSCANGTVIYSVGGDVSSDYGTFLAADFTPEGFYQSAYYVIAGNVTINKNNNYKTKLITMNGSEINASYVSTTAIEEINNHENVVQKYIQNGIFYIERNGRTYTITGNSVR